MVGVERKRRHFRNVVGLVVIVMMTLFVEKYYSLSAWYGIIMTPPPYYL